MTNSAAAHSQPAVLELLMTDAPLSASLSLMNEHFARILHEQKTGEWRREAASSRLVAASRDDETVTRVRPLAALGSSLRRRLMALAAHVV